MGAINKHYRQKKMCLCESRWGG